jgi:hypothetical protein
MVQVIATLQATNKQIVASKADIYPHAYDLAVLAQAAWQQGLLKHPN